MNAVFEPNVRARECYIARAFCRCGACGRDTRVVALGLPADHETLEMEEPEAFDGSIAPGAQTPEVWQQSPFPAWIFYVEAVSEAALLQLVATAPHYRRKPPDTGDPTTHAPPYWANHCEHCDAWLDDHELYCEPGGAFMPMNPRQAARIELWLLRTPFMAAASGYSAEPVLFDSMRTR